MFRDATKARQASLSNPLLHPVSSVPTDAAILRLQFDSSPPWSILDSYRTPFIRIQRSVRIPAVCRMRGRCSKDACVCVSQCCLGSVQARRESKTAITSDQVLSSYNWLHKMLNVDEVQQMYEQLCRRE